MGFGAIIASGEKNNLLRDDLLDCITEVRVEQSLDGPTRFAIRFQEDISGSQPRIKGAPELGCGQMITIAVKVGDKTICLVRGPITDREWSSMLGGPGSWYEIRGQDRRIELDRECRREPQSGRESDLAQAILSKQFTRACVQETNVVYGQPNGNGEPLVETLNQRATDERFLCQIARRNNMHFWIEYDCQRNGLDPSGQSLKVEEIANLRSSPLRPEDAGILLDCRERITLDLKAKVTLRVNVDKERCPNVTAFNLKENSERPSVFSGSAIDVRTGIKQPTSAKDPQPPLAKRGKRIDRCGFKRDVCITTAGSVVDLLRKAFAALTDAGWFVEATASTTAYMLGDVLLPHDEVKVEGLGTEDGGCYQVKAVTHVINAADHFMDLELRRNATEGEC
jgi:hypothetical protein